MNGNAPAPRNPEPANRFRKTLIAVMAVQVITLLLLWMLQQKFAS